MIELTALWARIVRLLALFTEHGMLEMLFLASSIVLEPVCFRSIGSLVCLPAVRKSFMRDYSNSHLVIELVLQKYDSAGRIYGLITSEFDDGVLIHVIHTVMWY